MPFRDEAGGNVLLLTGSGRSGTTWLAEALTASLKARLIFEPFRPGVVAELGNLGNRQYLRPGEPAPQFQAGIERIFEGRLRSRWTDRYNDRLVYRSRVIKAIRANLMIGWMLDAFPELRVLHVIRAPLATMASQMRGNWNIDKTWLTGQADLMADYLGGYESLIDLADSPEKEVALKWAVENYVPVHQVRERRWPDTRFRIFSYDTLVNDRAQMIGFLEFAGVSAAQIDWATIERPSRVSRGRVDFGQPTDHHDRPAGFKPDIVDYIARLVETFDLSEWVSVP